MAGLLLIDSGFDTETAPIAHFRLNDSGVVAADNSGFGMAGTHTDVTTGATGIGDGLDSITYDGSTSYTDIFTEALKLLFKGQEGTVIIWAKVSAAGVWTDGTEDILITIYEGTNEYLEITKTTTSNQLRFEVSATGPVKKTVNHTFSDTDWFMAAATWSAVNNEFKAYVNGVQVGSTQTAGTLGTGFTLTSTTTVIGSSSTTPASVWDGELAHAAIWTTPLTDGELLNIYNKEMTGLVSLLYAGSGLQLSDNGWSTRDAEQKQIRFSSLLSEGSGLLDTAPRNITEKLKLELKGTSHDNVSSIIKDIYTLQRKAREFNTTNWRKTPVYLEARTLNETDVRYSLIHDIRMRSNSSLFGSVFDPGNIIENIEITIEREPYWRDKIPQTLPPFFSISAPQAPSTQNDDSEQFISNFRHDNALTHILNYDDSLTAFSSNLIASPSFNYFEVSGSTPAVDDIVYFGSTDGEFFNVTINTAAITTGVSFDLEYYNGSTWAAGGSSQYLLFQSSAPAGQYVIVANGLSSWAATSIDGVSAHWIRIKATVVGSPSTITQTGQVIYSVEDNYISVPNTSIDGDVDAIGFIRYNTRVTPSQGVMWAIFGIKSRGLTTFTGRLNFGGQNPANWSEAYGTDTSQTADVTAPGGNMAECSFATDQTLVKRANIVTSTSAIEVDFEGEYQVFLRCEQVGGAIGDVTVKLRTSHVQDVDSIDVALKTFSSGAGEDGPEVVNLGKIRILSSGLFYSETIQATLDLQIFAKTKSVAYSDELQGIQSANLQAHWPLADTGSTADDESGNNYDGTHTAVTSGATGIGDGRDATTYDGSTSYTDIYSSGFASAFSGAAGTVSVWAKVSGAGIWTDGTNREVVRILADGSNYVIIDRDTANDTLRFLYNAAATTETVTVSTSSTDWMHLAITWSKANDEVKVYFNGSQSGGTQTGLGTWAGSPATNTTNIGAPDNTPSGNVWDGDIAHVAVWDKVLTSSEISDLSTSSGAVPTLKLYDLVLIPTDEWSNEVTYSGLTGQALVSTGTNIRGLDIDGGIYRSGATQTAFLSGPSDTHIVSSRWQSHGLPVRFQPSKAFRLYALWGYYDSNDAIISQTEFGASIRLATHQRWNLLRGND